jgi:glycosyltransferase involved in cell wall biosynthesis
MLRIGFICPTYDAVKLHSYTAAALRTFFETTPGGVAIVVDDGSRSWTEAYQRRLRRLAARYPAGELHLIRHSHHGGLTRSWNAGLTLASELSLDYVIAGNNDVLFTPAWYAGMLHALTNGYDLVGPLSNAPGITAHGKQEIERYVPDYVLSDRPAALAQLAERLYAARLGQVVESPINGFFQMAHLDTWRLGRYDAKHYYRPVNAYTSTGHRNPTPLMTLNEDELQARWASLGLSSAIVLSSFIFHYRAVSRGDGYKRGKWYRKA